MLAASARQACAVRRAGIAAELPCVAESQHISRLAAGKSSLHHQLLRLLDRPETDGVKFAIKPVAMKLRSIDSCVDAASTVKGNIGAANIARWRDELHHAVVFTLKAQRACRSAACAKRKNCHQANEELLPQSVHHVLVFLRAITNPCPSRVQVMPEVADLQTNGPSLVVLP